MPERLTRFLKASTLSLPALAVFFLCYEAALFLRFSAVLSSPRFIAEDGALFYAYALRHQWQDALFAPQLGYYSLFANVSTVLAARFASLDNAPVLPLMFALLAQLLPCLVVLTARGELFNANWKRILLLAILLLAPPSQGVWLSVHTSMFHFGATALLILLADTPRTPPARWFYRMLLLLAALNGVLACFLLPLFAFRAWKLREREAVLQLAFLTLGACAQLLAIADQWQFVDGRRLHNKPLLWLLPLVINKNLVLPFAGWEAAAKLSPYWLMQMHAAAPALLLAMVALLVFSTRLLFGCVPFWWQWWLLPGAFVLWTGFSYAGAYVGGQGILTYVHPAKGARYFYLTNLVLGLAVFTNLVKARYRQREIPALLLAIFLGQGAYQWWAYDPARYLHAPQWEREVDEWLMNPQYRLRLWGPSLRLHLPQGHD